MKDSGKRLKKLIKTYPCLVGYDVTPFYKLIRQTLLKQEQEMKIKFHKAIKSRSLDELNKLMPEKVEYSVPHQSEEKDD